MGTFSDPDSQQYTWKNFSHVEFVTFLEEKAHVPKNKVIDALFLDIEYAEYSMLDYFYLDGKLDLAEYTICQWNGEFHAPDENQKAVFGKFMKRIVKEERYLLIILVYMGHWRTYFVNVADQRCFDRYVKGRI
uniref:Methyltransf_21 domain-containing protein n=1 Tax=Steinernema glaseri TaxID=37863 RepID=A0A1I7YUX6_9BILA